MEGIFKQPVVVEHLLPARPVRSVRSGGSTCNKPDGYTLLSHNTGISGYAEVDKLFGRPVKTSRADFIPLARRLLVNDLSSLGRR